ncbi:hypothetical protein, conserved [Leishmania tarentolae]|uniref:KATNIP domain-containing protein n=1 Tax=Leishmania tarentolae TaxID=5689 RepID=A0A640KPV6_LEITA|nr:hypothetical protein, conserved [Leishmania tarentolae]
MRDECCRGIEGAKVAADAAGSRCIPGGSCSPISVETIPLSTQVSKCGSRHVRRVEGTPKTALENVSINVTSTSLLAKEAPFPAATAMAVHRIQNTRGVTTTDLNEHTESRVADTESPHAHGGLPITSLSIPRFTRASIVSNDSRNTSQTQFPTAMPITAGDATSGTDGDAPQLVDAGFSQPLSSDFLSRMPPASTPRKLSCLSRSAAAISASLSAPEMLERCYSDSSEPAELVASSPHATSVSTVDPATHAADFRIHRISHEKDAALLTGVTQESALTTPNALDDVQSPPHLAREVRRTSTSIAGTTSDSTALLSTPAPFSSSAVADTAQCVQTLMGAIHSRRQRLSHTSELSARHHPRAASGMGASLFSEPSLPRGQLSPQRVQATLRPSVYRDIHSAPEGMSGRRVPLSRRRLHMSGGSADPSHTAAVSTHTGAVRLRDQNRDDTIGQHDVSLQADVPAFLRHLGEESASCTQTVAMTAKIEGPSETDAVRRVLDAPELSIASCAGTALMNLAASQHDPSFIPYSTLSPRRGALTSEEGSCVLAAPSLVRLTTPRLMASSLHESTNALATSPSKNAGKDGQMVNDGTDTIYLDRGQTVEELPCAGTAANGAEGYNTFVGVASDTTELAPVLADTMPYGRCFTLNMLTTWGDAHEVGLCGLELFDDSGQRLLPCPATAAGAAAVVSQTASMEGDVVVLGAIPPNGFVRAFAEYTATEVDLVASTAAAAGDEDVEQARSIDDAVRDDPRRQLCTLICPHPLNTHDETHMFAVPYTAGKPHLISFVFAEPVRLSVMRLHNYAGRGRVHTTKGVRIAEAWMDETVVFRGEVRANSGELCRGERVEEAEDGAVHGHEDPSSSQPSSMPPATSFSLYGLENCENVLWTTDAAVLARIMAHGPPSTTLPLREVDHTASSQDPRHIAGGSVESGADAPHETTPPSAAGDDPLNGDSTTYRPVSARPLTMARRSRAPPARFTFCSARQTDVTMPRRYRTSADGVLRLRGDEHTSKPLHVSPACFSNPRGSVETWAKVATDVRAHQVPVGVTADPAPPELHGVSGQDDRQQRKQRRRHLNRQTVLDPDRCPRRVTAICVMVLSTWGATQHVGLNCLRLRDASGDVVGTVDVQRAALHYPDGTSSVFASCSCSGNSAVRTIENSHHDRSATSAKDGIIGSVNAEGEVCCSGECHLARAVRGLLHSDAYCEEGASDANQQEYPCDPCLLPFQSAMQLVFIFRDPISELGFLDVANYSVGDQTCCGVKEARVFFAEQAEGGTTAATWRCPSAEVFRHLWHVGASSQSRHALAAARVYEVTPPDGVTLRKAPAFLDSARFQSYDVSLHGPGLPPPRSPCPSTATVQEDDTAAAAAAAPVLLGAQAPQSNPRRELPPSAHDAGVPFADHLGHYEIASGPGTCGARNGRTDTGMLAISDINANGVGGKPCARRRHFHATSASLTSSLGASVNIRANVAMHRARMSLLQERPAWLLEYQPYVTPLLPVGYVCKLRLTICARDVPAAEPLDPSAGRFTGAEGAKPTHRSASVTSSSVAMASAVEEAPAHVASVITAGDSLKAYLKEWLVKPLRSCSFVNEHGDVVKPMRPDKYRAMMHEEAARCHTTSLQVGNVEEDSEHERALARCVPMVAESMVSAVPVNHHPFAPKPPLQVVTELLYVADVPFCISLVALHKPLVARGSAAWVRQVQVFVDDALVFSSGEACVQRALNLPGNGEGNNPPGVGAGVRAGESQEATRLAGSGSFGSKLSNSQRGVADAANQGAQLWRGLPRCTTSLKPYVVFTLDPDLLDDLHAEATTVSSSWPS